MQAAIRFKTEDLTHVLFLYHYYYLREDRRVEILSATLDDKKLSSISVPRSEGNWWCVTAAYTDDEASVRSTVPHRVVGAESDDDAPVTKREFKDELRAMKDELRALEGRMDKKFDELMAMISNKGALG